MGRITQILFENGINMNTLITNDSAEFGIIRMLVSDTDLAATVLQKAGYMCHSDVVKRNLSAFFEPEALTMSTNFWLISCVIV